MANETGEGATVGSSRVRSCWNEKNVKIAERLTFPWLLAWQTYWNRRDGVWEAWYGCGDQTIASNAAAIKINKCMMAMEEAGGSRPTTPGSLREKWRGRTLSNQNLLALIHTLTHTSRTPSSTMASLVAPLLGSLDPDQLLDEALDHWEAHQVLRRAFGGGEPPRKRRRCDLHVLWRTLLFHDDHHRAVCLFLRRVHDWRTTRALLGILQTHRHTAAHVRLLQVLAPPHFPLDPVWMAQQLKDSPVWWELLQTSSWRPKVLAPALVAWYQQGQPKEWASLVLPQPENNKETNADDDDEDDEVFVEDDDEDDEDDDEDDEEEDDEESPTEKRPSMDLDESSHETHIEDEAAHKSSPELSTSTTKLEEKTDDKKLPDLPARQRCFVAATMRILSDTYPIDQPRNPNYLDVHDECQVLQTVNHIVRPPPSPLHARIFLRRAPTQEEFFRGSISRNPVPISQLAGPTVAHLRQYIADELQMSDSAELIEILVGQKILDTSLCLRLVLDVFWRKHLAETRQVDTQGIRMEDLPYMVATYRLAGVDGEATEDTLDELVDPQAEAQEAQQTQDLLEKEYGLTKMVLHNRGAWTLMRSIQFCVSDRLRRIRRDDVDSKENNPSRDSFRQDPPSPGLILLSHCIQLPANRQNLLTAQAPTTLLALLLDVLQALDDTTDASTSCPTAEKLQSLIEQLTSDISSSTNEDTPSLDARGQDGVSLPMVLESIESMALCSSLRGIVAKLLPFLTYGQPSMSIELAQRMDRAIDTERLMLLETSESTDASLVLMETFVETLVNLPATSVGDSLRVALKNNGFVEKMASFVCRDIPKQPPSWSPSLWAKSMKPEAAPRKKRAKGAKRKTDDSAWQAYYSRRGVRSAMKILTGLCRRHEETQKRLASLPDFLANLHWLEATSDSKSPSINTNGLGLLAETLLDEVIEENPETSRLVAGVRDQTKARKKELALDRRKKELSKLSSFGSEKSVELPAGLTAGSLLAPVFDLFRENVSEKQSALDTKKAAKQKETTPLLMDKEMPAWMKEMESMEEETGMTCAICQEGLTVQPKELLGVYAFITKVSLSSDQGGAMKNIDGLALLQQPPKSISESLEDSFVVENCYPVWKTAAEDLDDYDPLGCACRRTYSLTTTVCAGNAIHFSCHRRARQADRAHPKAPKTEWEGALLRNSRAKCNVVVPVLSKDNSSVPLMSIENALSEMKASISSVLGSTPRSSLWSVLHDIRLLLLRISYGEALNSDSGGGSLTSNLEFLAHQFELAKLLERDAQVDHPQASLHVHGLTCAFLTACAVGEPIDLIAEAAPMAAVTTVIFHPEFGR